MDSTKRNISSRLREIVDTATIQGSIEMVRVKDLNTLIKDLETNVDTNMWYKVSDKKPVPMVEVLVEIDGHRNSMWRNNHNLVAYMSTDGNFYEERHKSNTPLNVTHWMDLPTPPQN